MVSSGAWYTRKKDAAIKVYVQLPNGTFHLKDHKKKDFNSDKFHTESRVR